jgi:hypothetical protein
MDHPAKSVTSAGGWLTLLLACLVTGLGAIQTESTDASKEYQVKAAYLLNFAQYIHWPEESVGGPDAPLSFGVLGDEDFGELLEKTFQDQTVQGRRLVVKRSDQVGGLKSCQLIFISRSQKEHLPEVLVELKETAIVSVGEVEKFASRGGIINFYFDKGKVRFEINEAAARRKGIKISSQLLKRAKIVDSDSNSEGAD